MGRDAQGISKGLMNWVETLFYVNSAWKDLRAPRGAVTQTSCLMKILKIYLGG